MKVKELIKRLQGMPQDAEVCYDTEGCVGIFDIDTVTLDVDNTVILR